MEEITIRCSRNALLSAIYVLRYTPIERLSEAYKVLTGREMNNAHMKLHAGMYDQLYSMIISDLDERYGPWTDQPEMQTGLNQEDPA